MRHLEERGLVLFITSYPVLTTSTLSTPSIWMLSRKHMTRTSKMMRTLPAVMALLFGLGVSADAYAGIAFYRKDGSVSVCIGSAEYCNGLRTGQRQAGQGDSTVHLPGFSDKLEVTINGKSMAATSVSVSDVEGGTGTVTVQRRDRVIFSDSLDLSSVAIADRVSGYENNLSELAKLTTCEPM